MYGLLSGGFVQDEMEIYHGTVAVGGEEFEFLVGVAMMLGIGLLVGLGLALGGEPTRASWLLWGRGRSLIRQLGLGLGVAVGVAVGYVAGLHAGQGLVFGIGVGFLVDQRAQLHSTSSSSSG